MCKHNPVDLYTHCRRRVYPQGRNNLVIKLNFQQDEFIFVTIYDIDEKKIKINKPRHKIQCLKNTYYPFISAKYSDSPSTQTLLSQSGSGSEQVATHSDPQWLNWNPASHGNAKKTGGSGSFCLNQIDNGPHGLLRLKNDRIRFIIMSSRIIFDLANCAEREIARKLKLTTELSSSPVDADSPLTTLISIGSNGGTPATPVSQTHTNINQTSLVVSGSVK